MAKAAAPSPTPVDVMIGWLGTKEVPGAKANPVIAGKPTSWFSLIGHPEITSDEIANCATAVGASEVVAALLAAGFTLDDVTAETPALKLLEASGCPVVLPPLDQRMLARSYCTWGTDARKNPKRNDVMVIPRGAKWQGHVMRLVEDLGGGRWKCIGANQSDATSYAIHHLSEAIAIRRGVPATVKELRKAGSQAVARGDHQEAAGVALAVGVPAVTATTKVIEASAGVAQPAADAAMNLQPIADQTGVVHTLTSTGIALGNLFIENPWLVGCMGAGILVWWLGRTGKLRRLAQHIAGAPLSSQTA